MSVSLYRCEFVNALTLTKDITRISIAKDDPDFLFSQSCIVYKYEYLYRKYEDWYIQKHKQLREHAPYALPGKSKSIRVYNGLDREPLAHSPGEAARCSYDEMLEIFQSLSGINDLEVIFVRAAGSDADIPYGLHFLGYDVCYPPGGDGFSAICDCMFLCRWHGCDEAGTEFTDDFMRLNENGLFDSKQEAEIYLRHYAIQDWAETGDFCILEIYK